MTIAVDLNCDMGESFGAYRIGADDAVFPFITSANVACGYHGGDPAVMRTTLARAQASAASPSARIPGFQDLIGFGRRNMDVDAAGGLRPRRLSGRRADGLRARGEDRAAAREGARRALQHGRGEAGARGGDRARRARRRSRSWCCSGFRAVISISEGESAGLTTAGEAFADRNYMSDGSLVSRKRAGRASPRRGRGRAARDPHGARGKRARRSTASDISHARRHDLHPRRRSARGGIRASGCASAFEYERNRRARARGARRLRPTRSGTSFPSSADL